MFFTTFGGCLEEEKDKEVRSDRCWKFVSDHITDFEGILMNVEESRDASENLWREIMF